MFVNRKTEIVRDCKGGEKIGERRRLMSLRHKRLRSCPGVCASTDSACFVLFCRKKRKKLVVSWDLFLVFKLSQITHFPRSINSFKQNSFVLTVLGNTKVAFLGVKAGYAR